MVEVFKVAMLCMTALVVVVIVVLAVRPAFLGLILEYFGYTSAGNGGSWGCRPWADESTFTNKECLMTARLTAQRPLTAVALILVSFFAFAPLVPSALGQSPVDLCAYGLPDHLTDGAHVPEAWDSIAHEYKEEDSHVEEYRHHCGVDDFRDGVGYLMYDALRAVLWHPSLDHVADNVARTRPLTAAATRLTLVLELLQAQDHVELVFSRAGEERLDLYLNDRLLQTLYGAGKALFRTHRVVLGDLPMGLHTITLVYGHPDPGGYAQRDHTVESGSYVGHLNVSGVPRPEVDPPVNASPVLHVRGMEDEGSIVVCRNGVGAEEAYIGALEAGRFDCRAGMAGASGETAHLSIRGIKNDFNVRVEIEGVLDYDVAKCVNQSSSQSVRYKNFRSQYVTCPDLIVELGDVVELQLILPLP